MKTPPRPSPSRVTDPYVVLGVPRTASRCEMAGAYRRLAKRYHPDVDPDPDAAEHMRRINAAWRELSNPCTGGARKRSTPASAHWSPTRATARAVGTGPSRSSAWGDQPAPEWFTARKSFRAPVGPRSRPPRCLRAEVRFQDTGLAAWLVAGVMVLLLFAAAFARSLSLSPLAS
jgi:curved DNA-binding protein CbpA